MLKFTQRIFKNERAQAADYCAIPSRERSASHNLRMRKTMEPLKSRLKN